MSGNPQSPALLAIRAATAAEHRALEHSLELAQPDAGGDAYVRYLAAMLGWLEPLEAVLWSGGWPAELRAEERAGKSGWLKSDLEARGFDQRQLAEIPRLEPRLETGSLAARFGLAYVIEGSQLGSQVLLRRLGPRLAPLPTRWLQGYGQAGAVRWRSFLTVLASCVVEPHELESAAESARLAFRDLRDWFVLRGAAA